MSNQFALAFCPAIFWIKRLLALVTVVTWAITPFTIAAIAHLIIALVKDSNHLWHDLLPSACLLCLSSHT